MNSALSPADYARRLFFMNAGCAYDGEGGSADKAYVRRMLNLLDGMRRGTKVLLFAFERAYGEDGKRDDSRTSFHIPDAYARETAREHPPSSNGPPPSTRIAATAWRRWRKRSATARAR